LIPELVPTFGEQGRLQESAAEELGLSSGIPVSYRAGDQPNNAYSLNVLKPGEMAATAGTSGVVYGVNDQANFDPQSRVNTFVHVNNTADCPRYGVLLCVNGTGILNSWLRSHLFAGSSYEDLNKEAATVAIGSDGLLFYPFGNGAERILSNKDFGACLQGLQFNRHGRGHLLRAAQEGIVFALKYGTEIMEEMGIALNCVRAGHTNMFLSEVFASSFANATGCEVELYNSDGAQGAARAAGVGIKWFKNMAESFKGMELVSRVEPSEAKRDQTNQAYQRWKKNLSSIIQ
jgi:xylulokinase